ncbi:MAG TPA: hypothetical protein VMS30_01915 [Phycisphaerales bacterium]|nr:hypothetical protein [Phycisphaerales bacterium]
MTWMEVFELLSYIVTVIGLPLAIVVFLFEQRKERENEEEEVYQMLSDAYIDFMKLVLDNPDLKLRSRSRAAVNLTDDQKERAMAMFEILVSLFERAYLLAYEDDMTDKQMRRWKTWEDFMREWCRRDDFRSLLPQLLQGEDAEFAGYIRRLADEEQKAPHAHG